MPTVNPDLKLKKTRIGHWFDGLFLPITSVAKEDSRFWGELQRFVRYDPDRTMLGEDSETNLHTAQEYGIRYLFYISHYSSTCTPMVSASFVTLDYFSRLIPVEGQSTVRIASSGGLCSHVI